MCDTHELDFKNLKEKIADLEHQLSALHDSRMDWREAAHGRPVLDDLRDENKQD